MSAKLIIYKRLSVLLQLITIAAAGGGGGGEKKNKKKKKKKSKKLKIFYFGHCKNKYNKKKF
jgi:hypothetical protein